MKYLQILAIPFYRDEQNTIHIDELWLNELQRQVKHFGPMTVLSPQLSSQQALKSWGPSLVEFIETPELRFAGFPAQESPWHFYRLPKIYACLKEEVIKADIVQSSNLFSRYFCLSYAHFLANKLSKKTIMVVAEDFYDMLEWEWVRLAKTKFEHWRRRRTLQRTDKLARRMLETATLSFINTPGAVNRYRTSAKNAVAIRHTNHEAQDVISDEMLQQKCAAIAAGKPLRISALARHNPIKGLDFFIHAIACFHNEGIPVEAKLYGFGELTEKLKKLTHKLGLDEILEFPGAVKPGKDIYRVMQNSDIFVMPHRTNDFGRVFYEAMTGGTPVVAFESSSSAQTVYRGVDGLLVPMDNVIALYQALLHLHLNRDLLINLSHGAQRRARTDTCSVWLNIRAEKINEIIEGILIE